LPERFHSAEGTDGVYGRLAEKGYAEILFGQKVIKRKKCDEKEKKDLYTGTNQGYAF
jgi:hypothetical protein